jgi:hypothetical protein
MTIPRAALVVAILIAPVVAAAQVSCGTIVGKGETVTLTADVGPCDGDSGSTAALQVRGGTLDLGGRTVRCGDLNVDGEVPQGIVLSDKKSKVMNGSVVGCANGIAIGGNGKHLVERVTSQNSLDDGFDIIQGPNKNKLIDVTAIANGSDGIKVDSDKNKITNAVTTGNAEDGIDLTSTADKNKITNARSENNGDDGIEVGGNKNKVKLSTAIANGEDGVDFGGVKNKVTGGSAQSNGAFDLNDCSGNKVKKFSFTTASADCP